MSWVCFENNAKMQRQSFQLYERYILKIAVRKLNLGLPAAYFQCRNRNGWKTKKKWKYVKALTWIPKTIYRTSEQEGQQTWESYRTTVRRNWTQFQHCIVRSLWKPSLMLLHHFLCAKSLPLFLKQHSIVITCNDSSFEQCLECKLELWNPRHRPHEHAAVLFWTQHDKLLPSLHRRIWTCLVVLLLLSHSSLTKTEDLLDDSPLKGDICWACTHPV